MTNKKCSICKGKIDSQMGWHGGHNAEPINSGRCCSNCNNNYVIPLRMQKLEDYLINKTTRRHKDAKSLHK